MSDRNLGAVFPRTFFQRIFGAWKSQIGCDGVLPTATAVHSDVSCTFDEIP